MYDSVFTRTNWALGTNSDDCRAGAYFRGVLVDICVVVCPALGLIGVFEILGEYKFERMLEYAGYEHAEEIRWDAAH